MTLVRLYLAVYLALAVAAAWVLQTSGILAHIPRLWLVLAAIVIVLLGAILALAAIPPRPTRPS